MKYAVGACLLALAGAVVSAAAAVGPGGLRRDPGESFVVQQAQGAPTVSLGGTVIPYKEVTLAAQLPGRVTYLAGIEGDTFKEGDLLVAIDDAGAARQAARHAGADGERRRPVAQCRRPVQPRDLLARVAAPPRAAWASRTCSTRCSPAPWRASWAIASAAPSVGADLFASGIQIQEAQNAMHAPAGRAAGPGFQDPRRPQHRPLRRRHRQEIRRGGRHGPAGPAPAEFRRCRVPPGRGRCAGPPARRAARGHDGQGRTGRRPTAGCRCGWPRSSPWPTPSATRSRSSSTCPRGSPSRVCTPRCWSRTSSAPARANPVIPPAPIRYNGSLPGVYVLDEQRSARNCAWSASARAAATAW